MEDTVDEEAPVVYAAWHIPCYAHHNCPDDTNQQQQQQNGNHQIAGPPLFDWDLHNQYDWLAFLFLWLMIFVSFIGICMIVGTLFVRECRVNKWYLRRPVNHFLLVLLSSDILMTMIVIPVHAYDLLGGDSKLTILRPGTCLFRICCHFMSVTTKSWSIVAYLILYHVHDGVIPTKRSVIVGIWVLIASLLISVPGVIFGVDSYINTEKCTLIPGSSQWPMILYISTIPFILPSCVLTPFLLKWSNLRKKLGVSRNISCDYLANYDEQEDTENQQNALKYYANREKDHQKLLVNTTPGSLPVIFVEHLEDEVNSEHSSCTNSVYSSTNDINVEVNNEIAKSNSLVVPISNRIHLNSFSRASKGTMNFLCADKNFPRILLTLSVVHIVLWTPFYINLILSSLLIIHVHEAIALFSVWLGYIETAITPLLIYLLSTFVSKVINQIFKDICNCDPKRRNSREPETI